MKNKIHSRFSGGMRISALLVLLLLNSASLSTAREIREIYVPFKDLKSILMKCGDRVLMSRSEFDDLLEKNKSESPQKAPVKGTCVAASYQVRVSRDSAIISAEIAFESLVPEAWVYDLDMRDISLFSAELDGIPAPLSAGENGQTQLLLSGEGRSTLKLRGMLSLSRDGAKRILNFQTPTKLGSLIKVTVNGIIKVDENAPIASCEFDPLKQETHLEILPQDAGVKLLMIDVDDGAKSLRSLLARSVQVVELKRDCEQLKALFSFKAPDGVIETIRIKVPSDFQVTDIQSLALSHWSVTKEKDSQILSVHLSQVKDASSLLEVSAIRSKPNLKNWRMPRLVPMDVMDHCGLLGLALDQSLKVREFEQSDICAIDNSVLASVFPRSSKGVKLVKAYYAPGDGGMVRASFDIPELLVDTCGKLCLILEESHLTLHAWIHINPRTKSVFERNLLLPEKWSVNKVFDSKANPLDFEIYNYKPGIKRLCVKFKRGIPVSSFETIQFKATCLPETWYEEWLKRNVVAPKVEVLDSRFNQGVLAIKAKGDLRVSPAEIQGLSPMDESEKKKFGLEKLKPDLLFQYIDQSCSAELSVKRLKARMTADITSFIKIGSDGFHVHSEIVYDITQAKGDKVTFSLPDSAPEVVSIKGLDGLELKEFSREVKEKRRFWTVFLAKQHLGKLRLSIDFQKSLNEKELSSFNTILPLVENVLYQSGRLALEGESGLEVKIPNPPRTIDIAELADADYQAGTNLLGVFGYAGEPPALTVEVSRPEIYPEPSAIATRLRLISALSSNGVSQTSACFELKTKSLFVEIRLPEKASLWSVTLDGIPAKPQSRDNKILLDIPFENDMRVRKLRVVYEKSIKKLWFWDKITLNAPVLFSHGREGSKFSEIVPVMETDWSVHMPSGHWAISSSGGLETNQIVPPESALNNLGKALYTIGGGVGVNRGVLTLLLLPALNSAREKARRISCASNLKQIGLSCKQYAMDYKDNFPDKLSALCHESYLTDVKIYQCPSTSGLITSPDDSNYTYTGSGLTEAASANTALAYCDNHTNFFNFLFLDGHVTGYAAAGDPYEIASARGFILPKFKGRPRKATPIWAVEGMRSLTIPLAGTGPAMYFKGLSQNPKLSLTMLADRRLNFISILGFAIVFLGGVSLTFSRFKKKLIYISAICVFAILLPLVSGWTQLILILNGLIYGAFVLIPYYFILWIIMPGCLRLRRQYLMESKGVATLFLICFAATLAIADKSESPGHDRKELDQTLIIPYYPGGNSDKKEEACVLAPRSIVDKASVGNNKVAKATLPLDYVFTGASFKCQINGNSAIFEGYVDFRTLCDRAVAIPLFTNGISVTQALLDGQTANLVGPAQNHRNSGKKQRILLRIASPGKHQLKLVFKVKASLHGDWWRLSTNLPPCPTTNLKVEINSSESELRLKHGCEDRLFELRSGHSPILTTPSPDGELDISWRPKVTAGETDRVLVTDSLLAVDLSEERVLAKWDIDLSFRGSERSDFSFSLPKAYQIEKITGQNIRSWKIDKGKDKLTLNVRLLKSALNKEKLTIYLFKRNSKMKRDKVFHLAIPALSVIGAARNTGKILIRHSGNFGIQIEKTKRVKRVNLSEFPSAKANPIAGPIALKTFQAYQFSSTPFEIHLLLKYLHAKVAAEIKSILRLGRLSWTMESKIDLDVSLIPAYQITAILPQSMELTNVSGNDISEWSVDSRDAKDPGSNTVSKNKILTVNFASGVFGKKSIILHARGEKRLNGNNAEVPFLFLEKLHEQNGRLVVLTDPDFELAAGKLNKLEPVLLKSVYPWLNTKQRDFARMAFRYSNQAYSGELLLRAKIPDISCVTVSNVRVSNRSIEESVLLDFTIHNAGIRKLSFELPERMAKARVAAPFLRNTVVKASKDNQVAFTVEFQDEIMKNIKILIKDERPADSKSQMIPIPKVISGRPRHQFAAIENVAWDELLIKHSENVSPINKNQKEWEILESLLTSDATQVFRVNSHSTAPSISFKKVARESVRTAGARIGLAQSVLVIAPDGTYRGEQKYHIDNQTEQFLELQLPPKASIWQVLVGSKRVKPVLCDNGHVAIPLFKTNPGDLDYLILVNYGGKLENFIELKSVDFPFINSVNINVESSRVDLRLPKAWEWFDFGGTTRRIERGVDYEAVLLSYKNNLAKRLVETLKFGSKISKIRSSSNLKQIGLDLKSMKKSMENYSSMDSQLNKSLSQSESIIRDVDQELKKAAEEAERSTLNASNTIRIDEEFENQNNVVVKNLVFKLGPNWIMDPSPNRNKRNQFFDEKWLNENFFSQNLQQPKESNQRMNKKLELSNLSNTGSWSESWNPLSNDPQKTLDRGSSKSNSVGDKDKLPTGHGSDIEQPLKPLKLPALDRERWCNFRFTTPRGEVKINARSIPISWMKYVQNLLLNLFSIGILAFIAKLFLFKTKINKFALGKTLQILGLISLIFGILPIAGIFSVISGYILKKSGMKS